MLKGLEAEFLQVFKQFEQERTIYLDKHRHRIINYEYHQAEQICSIGSGSVEYAVKQIDRRTKISGAQWE